jgi:type IV fimbrial biogenesis protein FimT
MDDPTDGCATEPSPTTAPRIIARASGGTGSSRTATVSAVDAEDNPASWLAFDNYGRVQSGTTSIVRIDVDSSLSNDEKRPLSLVVSTAGSIRMCDPAVTSTTDSRKCP